jgi:hypothetical protein
MKAGLVISGKSKMTKYQGGLGLDHRVAAISLGSAN